MKKWFLCLLCLSSALYSQDKEYLFAPHNVVVAASFGMAFNSSFYGYGGGLNFGYLRLKESGSTVHSLGFRIGFEAYSYGDGVHYFFNPIQYMSLESLYGTVNFTYSAGFKALRGAILFDIIGVGAGVGGTSRRTGVWNGFYTEETITPFVFKSKIDIILPFGVSMVSSLGYYMQFSHKLMYVFERDKDFSTSSPIDYFFSIAVGWVGGKKQPAYPYSGDYSKGELPSL